MIQMLWGVRATPPLCHESTIIMHHILFFSSNSNNPFLPIVMIFNTMMLRFYFWLILFEVNQYAIDTVNATFVGIHWF